MNSKPDSSRKSDELSWLENLQRNSWEPEVIISGIILAFLFAFPSKIYAFSAMLVQEFGLNYAGAVLVLFYLSAVISVFKIFFVVHLVLRFIWAGFLGLSYAFPQGVIHEKLFKISQHFEYLKPGDMVLAMERICSMTFAYPISLVFTILVSTAYLVLLLFLYYWLKISFFIIYLIFMISLLVFALFVLINKNAKWRAKMAKTMMASVGAIYQSNLGKWFSVFYGLGIFLLAMPLIYNDVRDFSMFFNESNLLENELKWPTKELSYSEFHQEEKRYPRAFLSTETVRGDYLKLGIARYAGDDQYLIDLNENFKKELDSLGWHELVDTPDLYRFTIGDEVIRAGSWKRNRLQVTDQKVYETMLPIGDLPPGIYTLKIEKLLVRYNLFTNKPEEIRLREQWDEIDFIKE
ncbi:hypothetical protein E4S40_06940 [Algoriphagus kandeliae]|uniref:Uncharacterized protein n=1 Tax=Algoriphagus kandeliae TaxID=2562278 RepID=A0A4Y9QTN7_9BACT|nr:hypothetical protein [Algoriphagus kandeliae]TFV95954.1 hypothetical protein E4S40_06940 [Algoriphagus kandeliae]